MEQMPLLFTSSSLSRNSFTIIVQMVWLILDLSTQGMAEQVFGYMVYEHLFAESQCCAFPVQ